MKVRWHDTKKVDTIMSVGAAASWPFVSGGLARIANSYARFILEDSKKIDHYYPHVPLSCHTSLGLTPHYERLADILVDHINWPTATVNFQVEGASAVSAACEILRSQSIREGRVAVCASSYHGPRGLSFGGGAVAPEADTGTRASQIEFPKDIMKYSTSSMSMFTNWLDEHASQVSVMLIEPQSGSSLCGRAWDPEALRTVTAMARERGILVCCDEVMCGMGRHGQGGLFLTRAWGVEADAVVFGKGIGGGVVPLAGSIIKNSGVDAPSHCHTYAGAMPHIAIVALQVLKEFENSGNTRSTVDDALATAVKMAGSEFFKVHGQGAMWGLEWNLPERVHGKAAEALRRACIRHKVWPYFVQSGILITPPLDACPRQLDRAITRLICAVRDDEFRNSIDNIVVMG